MGLSRKLKRRSKLEERVFDARVNREAEKIAKTVMPAVFEKAEQEASQLATDTAILIIGGITALLLEKHWAKLAPKATRREVYAHLLHDEIVRMNGVKVLSDEQKEAINALAKIFDIPWRL